MVVASIPRATLADLDRAEGKAELIGGRIVQMASGHRPASIAEIIFIALWLYAKQIKKGVAHADGTGYAVPPLLSGPESFAPDASYYDGPLPANPMRFIQGPPTLAVEVRSENDYVDAAEEAMADKRNDYYAAGTQVVWDVDPRAKTVAVYRATDPANPTIFRSGTIADAEPAVPGWRMAVDDIFNF